MVMRLVKWMLQYEYAWMPLFGRSAFGFDFDAEFGRNIHEELRVGFKLAKSLDRGFQMNLPAIDIDTLLLEGFGNITGSHRTEQLARFAGFGMNLQRHLLEFCGKLPCRLALLLDFASLLLLFGLKSLEGAFGSPDGKTLRNQVIIGITILDVDYFTSIAKSCHILS